MLTLSRGFGHGTDGVGNVVILQVEKPSAQT
jgi:hypothetical protein